MNGRQFQKYDLEDFLGGMYFVFGLSASLLISETTRTEHKILVFLIGVLTAFLISYYEVYGWSAPPKKTLFKFSTLLVFYILGFLPSFLPELDVILEIGIIILGFVISVFVSKKAVLDPIVESLLVDRLNSLKNNIQDVAGSNDYRVNIIFVKRNFPFIGKQYLTIDITTGGYAEIEKKLKWTEGEGTVGMALEQGQEVWFNRTEVEQIDQNSWGSARFYNQINEPKSVLSVPIYTPSDMEKQDPIGILNVDSPEPLEDSRLNEEEIRETVINHANIIGAYIHTLSK